MSKQAVCLHKFTPCPPAPLMMYLGIYTAIPTAPSPPRMLTMIGEPTGSTVELNWLPPLHPNGAIHYDIEYEPAMTPGDPVNAGNSSSPYFTLTLPNEFLTCYSVGVAAVNTQGRSRSGSLTLMCPERSTGGGMRTEYTIESVIDTYRHACINTIGQSDNDAVT